jgi:hypothetical protein
MFAHRIILLAMFATLLPLNTAVADNGMGNLKVYGESSAQAALLRQFRDGVLMKSPEGRAIIELYYRWSHLIAQALREDDQLREEIRVLVGDMIDVITAR